MAAADRPVPQLVVIVTVAVLARAITFGNPILHTDESYYFVVAHAWAHGALPYLEVWDRKPIGLFLLYLPAGALGYPAGIWAYQALALASLVATAWLIRRLAMRAGWERGALATALLYVLWVNLLEGQGGQAPIFYNLPVAAAATLIVPRAGHAVRPARGLAAMLLVGVALQIKYSVVFEGVFFGGWLLVAAWRSGGRATLVPYALALVGAALLPTAIAWGVYQVIGGGAAWLFANVTSILARHRDPVGEQGGNFAILLLLTSPVIAASLLGWQRGLPATRATRRWLAAWGAAAVLGVLVFGTWFDHYALPMMVPMSVLAAGFFAAHPRGRRIMVPMLIVAFTAGQAMLIAKRRARGTPAQFAALASAIGPGRGCLYVYSGEPMLYPATGRCTVTRYLFPSHLSRTREAGATGIDQRAEVIRILAARPAIVVVKPSYPGERPDLHALVLAGLRTNYRLRAQRRLGAQQVAIYQRR